DRPAIWAALHKKRPDFPAHRFCEEQDQPLPGLSGLALNCGRAQTVQRVSAAFPQPRDARIWMADRDLLRTNPQLWIRSMALGRGCFGNRFADFGCAQFPDGSNAARQASLRLALFRRRQAVMART